ncbi:MAG: 2-octaprenyl-3-methyl-6-methoxy-1,4-benzoquinol hydroxylase [Betaproteobacteria bacterium]|nr:2-octaprenyl-3-methyl-6-methoxy-1,4-benzoquinol hydroxylase [Betaproteobacteria bacterium]
MEFDVIVAGAGSVGCAAALALDNLGLTVCLTDPKPFNAFSAKPTDPWDSRVYTISPGSEQLLAELGVWARLDASRLGMLYRMEVHGDTPDGAIAFDAMRAGVSHLACVVEGNRLQSAMEQEIAQRPALCVMAPSVIDTIDWTSGAVRVVFGDGRSVRGQLLIGADGADSFVRSKARLGVSYASYGQGGVVANFEADKAHDGRAFQWFRRDGVLALLPLPGRMLSMVWSTATHNAARLCALSGGDLAREVQEASGNVLGALTVVTSARSFPLRQVRAEAVMGLLTVLVGDAAHCVHPLAGQGVNLGFRDVEALARVLGERPLGTGVGESGLLKKYQRQRLQDTMSVFALTDGLHRLFAAHSPLLRAIRNRGMSAVDGLPVLKSALVRRALH